MSEERWLPVEGWPYEVSDQGRVRRSVTRGRSWAGRIVKPLRHQSGYIDAHLCDRKRKKLVRVHRLVACAFISPKPFEGAEINHKNSVKSDNRADNLEWVTRSENALHSFRAGTRASWNKGKFHTPWGGAQIRSAIALVDELGMTFVEAARVSGMPETTVFNWVHRARRGGTVPPP